MELIRLGYLHDAADGIFGKKTGQAVQAFQRANGIVSSDGIATNETLQLLFLGPEASSTPSATPTPKPTQKPTQKPTPRPTPTPSPKPTRTTKPTPTPVPTRRITTFPKNGTVTYYGSAKYAEKDSVLEIDTQYSYEEYYYVVLANLNGEKRVSLCVHAGQSAEVYVPSGNYWLYYACGTTWYGDKDLFGELGAYAKAETSYSYQASGGWTYTLYTVESGNMSTDSIGQDSFPK